MDTCVHWWLYISEFFWELEVFQSFIESQNVHFMFDISLVR
jgi:hypothetical protein